MLTSIASVENGCQLSRGKPNEKEKRVTTITTTKTNNNNNNNGKFE